MDLLKHVKKRAMKMTYGVKHVSCEERSSEFSLFSLESKDSGENL